MTFHLPPLCEMKTSVLRPGKRGHPGTLNRPMTQSALTGGSPHVLHHQLSFYQVNLKHLRAESIFVPRVTAEQSTKNTFGVQPVGTWSREKTRTGRFFTRRSSRGTLNSTWINYLEGRTTLCRFKHRRTGRQEECVTYRFTVYTKYQRQQQPPCNKTESGYSCFVASIVDKTGGVICCL